jgi:hypothetical protein
MSGTTTSFPVKIALSPGFDKSTISPLKITSIDLGIDPAGMSEESSYSLSFCQSTITLSLWSNSHSNLFWHSLLEQRIGSVYLNCCSTFLTIPSLQSKQLKAPLINSGLVSVVLVTVPWMDISYPRH